MVEVETEERGRDLGKRPGDAQAARAKGYATSTRGPEARDGLELQ